MHDEIARMLAWCLSTSLQADGSFQVNIADGSLEDAEYYGTAFLAIIGFFNPKLRFWTNESFPEANEVRGRVSHFVQIHKTETRSATITCECCESLIADSAVGLRAVRGDTLGGAGLSTTERFC